MLAIWRIDPLVGFVDLDHVSIAVDFQIGPIGQSDPFLFSPIERHERTTREAEKLTVSRPRPFSVDGEFA